MKLSKVISLFLLLTLFSQMQVLIAYAKTEQPPAPGIAFLGAPEGEITIYEDKLPYTFNIVNQSTINLTVQVNLLGFGDVLDTDLTNSTFSLKPGGISKVKLNLKGSLVQASYNGLIVFSSQRGDVIYKAIALKAGTKPATEEFAKKEQVSLLNETQDINWNELDNKQFDLLFFNDGEHKAILSGKLYLLGEDSYFRSFDCTPKTLSIDPSSTGILQCDLGDVFQPPDLGSYAGFIIIEDEKGKWAQHFDFTLHVPSSETQVASGPKLEFLNGDEPVVLEYSRLLSDETIQIGLINKGQKDILVKDAQITFLNIINGNGETIHTPLFIKIENPSLTIPPLDIKYLRLTPVLSPSTREPIEGLPKDGTYQGYLIVKTENDQAVLVKTITLQVSAIDATQPTITQKIATGIQLWFQKGFNTEARFSTVEWVILSVFLVWLLFWLFSKIANGWWAFGGKIGPIVIEEVSGKPTLAPTMRYHLARCGILPSTSTPNTSTGFAGLKAVIAESDIPEVKFVTGVLNFIQAYLSLNRKQGYTVTCTTAGDETKPPVSLTAEIKLSRNGQTKRIYTLTGNTFEETGKSAAFHIFHFASGRRAALRHIPIWSRFPTPASYQKYKEANALANAKQYDDAVKQFAEAAQDAPFNASLRMGWGDTYEMQQKDTDALLVYLEAALMWPQLYGFWYRIAAKLPYAEKEKNKLEPLIRKLAQENLVILNKVNKTLDKYQFSSLENFELNKENLVRLSLLFLKYLETEIRFPRMLWNWIKWAFLNTVHSIFDRNKVQHRLAQYYWNYIPVAWGNGVQFQRMVKLAYLCTEQQIDGSSTNDSEVSSLLEKPWNQWQVHYNAACYYALLSKNLKDVDKKKKYAVDKAVTHLITAAKNPHSGVDMKWVQKDPDLVSLYEDPEFKALFDVKSKEEEDQTKDKEKQNLYQGIHLIGQVAAQQEKDWKSLPGKEVSPEELVTEADRQARVWESLVQLCNAPTDSKLLDQFWNIGMQKDENAPLKPTVPDLAGSLSMDTLNQCWKDIKNIVQPGLDLWVSRKQDTKVYLEFGKPQMKDVWKLWSKAEVRQWSYLDKLINHHMQKESK